MIQSFDESEQTVGNPCKRDKTMMRTLVVLVIIVLSTTAQADVIFPNLTADDLNGRSVNLPADFPEAPTVVFIAYKRNQQPSIDAWVERLGLRESGGLAWIEMPVVGRGAAFFRSFVDKGMRAGITSISMRAKTITVYSSRNAFNRSLGIDGRSEIYVALVDPDGTVHSLIKGDVTEAKVKKLRAAYP